MLLPRECVCITVGCFLSLNKHFAARYFEVAAFEFDPAELSVAKLGGVVSIHVHLGLYSNS